MDISPYLKKAKIARENLTKIYASFSPEKILIIWSLSIFSFLFFFASLVTYNQKLLISVPTYGGTLKEGILGTPRFINPVLASTEQDKDITSLVFAGLTKKDKNGLIILDMAESIDESEDGLTYTVTLKKGARFHDKKQVLADDVIFTINTIQNPIIKSPHYIEWEGTTLEKNTDTKLTFILKKPYPLFLEALSIGILPKHIWKNLSEDQISLSDLNIKAIGSGPYHIDEVRTESGIPVEITLKPHQYYTLGRPYLDSIVLRSYTNEKYLLQAFANKDISRIHGVSLEKIQSLSLATSSIKTSLLPRTFALFFNQNKEPSLAEKNVRLALQMAINKKDIVNQALYSYGKVLTTPYPFDENQPEETYDPEQAKELLLKTKALKNASSSLVLTLATANTDEMKKVAEMIKKDWEKIGVSTIIEIYDVSDLNQNIIKERDYQVLLFGAITENKADLYAFWHSSQRAYPGLNISNYVNKNLDTQLEIIRESKDLVVQEEAYRLAKAEFSNEVPGIFLFAPYLIYITHDKNISPLPIYSYTDASRFTLVESWYRYTDKVWPKSYYKPLLEKIENILH